ncbi:MAG TPA: hypothetical protein DDX89_03845 [Candidatus Omnitrophica bacterium]|nr:MAG: hypothetical protein A2Z92_03390 [Omnitrophica WOR_2 bacterium GWA2_63_20]OGX17822.1 MAG: hypothetical protein A2105_04920 [Omnitrophica WOR_2 bacterium GWF2_63_9]OGX31654.1 MAG: hypothetical protein A3E56_00965 [Omnitrophica WOR_2 bacterium RIFCSPHIGHO2_12_FULL_64_13]OGX35820.1 MAG: hypothetical protein A3B73_03750 [Omnitrophica WOR_2 bacterium RIFCSPHIGHO2_02_FULL_63_39]OGX44933.1 MAG: hypothetical protein A3I71_05290 [Omnitrophica WOR_2 bacterium RIFCSPLOWO2_02_FULL_63_16]OGX49342.1
MTVSAPTGEGVLMMNIHVNRVPFEGLREETSCDPSEMDLGRFDVHPTSPIALSCFITKADRELVVQATLRYQLQMCCSKCLETFASPVVTQATFSYQVAPTDVVDMTDDLRQEIILSYPMIPICQSSCLGLCPRCGQNRNRGACRCEQGA